MKDDGQDVRPNLGISNIFSSHAIAQVDRAKVVKQFQDSTPVLYTNNAYRNKGDLGMNEESLGFNYICNRK